MTEDYLPFDVDDIPEWLKLNAEGPKPWWQSRAIWGSLIAAAAGLAGLAGYTVDVPAVTEAIVGAATLVGAALAWYGRLRAERPISPRKVLPGLELPERGERDE
jgi:hypothetical protein